jgi:hypothetical protein
MLTFIIAEGPAKFYREFDGKPQNSIHLPKGIPKKCGVKAKSMLILPRKYSTIKPNRVFSFRKSPNSICYSFDLFN